MNTPLFRLDNILESVEDIASSAGDALSALASYLPTQEELAAYIPAQVDWLHMLRFLAIFAAATLLAGVVGRAVFGKRSGLNHAVSSAMGILFMVVISVLVYLFNPYGLARFLSPMPYVSFTGDYLVLFSFWSGDFTAICSEVLSMVILAFLVNLLDTLIPKGSGVVSWYLLRLLTVVLSMGLHFVTCWLIASYVPISLATYAPVILLGLLLLMMLLGVLNLVLGVLLTAVNPIFGGLYAFFFNNLIGKQLSKAVVTTLLLTALAMVLEYLGYTVLWITGGFWVTCLPLLLLLAVLWYLLGHVL